MEEFKVMRSSWKNKHKQYIVLTAKVINVSIDIVFIWTYQIGMTIDLTKIRVNWENCGTHRVGIRRGGKINEKQLSFHIKFGEVKYN